eukprot:476954-Prorocentrum_minimum.AAC.3
MFVIITGKGATQRRGWGDRWRLCAAAGSGSGSSSGGWGKHREGVGGNTEEGNGRRGQRESYTTAALLAVAHTQLPGAGCW